MKDEVMKIFFSDLVQDCVAPSGTIHMNPLLTKQTNMKVVSWMWMDLKEDFCISFPMENTSELNLSKRLLRN